MGWRRRGSFIIMAKKKTETLNLDAVLFKCRDILRKASNSGSFFEKRDLMLTLVFLRFIGEKFAEGVEHLAAQLAEKGLDPKDPETHAAFFDDPSFTDGTYNLQPEARWSMRSIKSATRSLARRKILSDASTNISSRSSPSTPRRRRASSIRRMTRCN